MIEVGTSAREGIMREQVLNIHSEWMLDRRSLMTVSRTMNVTVVTGSEYDGLEELFLFCVRRLQGPGKI